MGCLQFLTSMLLMQKPSPGKDVYQLFAEKVRDNKKLESRWAVLQETRVEYFRGKDFVAFLANHPEIKEILESDKDLDVEDVVNILLRKNLLVRCDRVIKTVRPGKKKLSSWPAHLEIYPVSFSVGFGHVILIPLLFSYIKRFLFISENRFFYCS